MLGALGSEQYNGTGVTKSGLFARELDPALTGQAVVQSGTQWILDPDTSLATVQGSATTAYENYEDN